MDWCYLIAAGLFEVVWAAGFKYADGFSKLIPSLITVAAMILSFGSLSIAVKTIPLSTAYTVWCGIGIVGTVSFGAIWLGESLTIARVIYIALVVIGIVGLRLSPSGAGT